MHLRLSVFLSCDAATVQHASHIYYVSYLLYVYIAVIRLLDSCPHALRYNKRYIRSIPSAVRCGFNKMEAISQELILDYFSYDGENPRKKPFGGIG